MAKAMIGLTSKYQTIRYDEGLKYGITFLLLAFIEGFSNFLMIFMFMRIGVGLARIYRKKILKKYLELHMSFYDITKNSPGALLTKLSIDTMQLNNLVLSIVGSTIQTGFTFILGLGFGCYYEYRLTLIMFCFVPFIAASIVIRRGLIRGSGKKGIKANIEAGGILSECVTNTKTIYSFNFQEAALKMYMGVLEYNKKQFIKDSFLSGLFIGIGQFCIFAGNAAVMAAAKHYILNNEINSEDLFMSMNIVMTSTVGIGNGLAQLGDIKKAMNAFKSIYSTLDTKSLINPFKHFNERKITANNTKGKIEFKNVYFAYPTRPEQVILKNISFIIYPGQQVALVGYSGSGKSTIIQLLTRFYDIEDKKGNKEEKIGSKEDPVSGGEKQRLAIARAFLKNPKILLLDEATSALDKDNEKLVQDSLDKLSTNRTSITIAHRLSTIEKCDKIFVLENGRLVEQGTHEQLMKMKNKYYILHKYSNMD